MMETADGRRQTATEVLPCRLRLLPSIVCRLPSLMGSILFHSLIALLILLWFSFSPSSDRGAPGDRNATGSIIAQPSGGGQQAVAETVNGVQQATETAMTELEQFTANLAALPIPSVLSPGPNQNAIGPSAASATDTTMAFQQGNQRIGHGVGAGTGEATVQVFGTGGKGMTFMYVFDRSTSMEGAKIRAAKAELTRSLDALGDLHRFNIIFYSSQNSMRLWEGGRKLLFATAQNKQSAVRFVSSITAEGSTRHYEPLLEAIAHRPDVIFFLTDGESQDDLTAVQLGEIERRNSQYGHGAQINVIQFGSGGFTDSESRSLKQLAEQNFSGQYLYVNVSVLR